MLRRFSRAALVVPLLLAGFPINLIAADDPAPFRALIVGGGPSEEENAAQIEGHVGYVAKLLPKSAPRTLLFTDGKATTKSVAGAETGPAADAKQALAILLPKNELSEPVVQREPALGSPIDASSSIGSIHRAFIDMSAQFKTKPSSLMLFFAGHGGPDGNKEQNVEYDLWDGRAFTVHDMAAEVSLVPANCPIVLVMAQCYSGAFANVILRNGTPKGELVPQNIVGFFSARKNREAAGCGLGTNEEDYQDFSSYFFGALCGYSRFGHPVTGADYDANGTVSLHEAFCYALIHDDSIDTPVCTSYAFLQRFASMPDAEVYAVPYPQVAQAASPGQRAALDSLSQHLGLDGDARILTAFDRLTYRDPLGTSEHLAAYREKLDRLNDLRLTTLDTFFKQWPALRWRSAKGYDEAVDKATKALTDNPTLCRDLMAAAKAEDDAENILDIEEARLDRLLDLYRAVVLAKNLREHGNETTKKNFEKLWRAEQQTLPLAYPQPAK